MRLKFELETITPLCPPSGSKNKIFRKQQTYDLRLQAIRIPSSHWYKNTSFKKTAICIFDNQIVFLLFQTLTLSSQKKFQFHPFPLDFLFSFLFSSFCFFPTRTSNICISFCQPNHPSLEKLPICLSHFTKSNHSHQSLFVQKKQIFLNTTSSRVTLEYGILSYIKPSDF